jgi:hypothetical protein
MKTVLSAIALALVSSVAAATPTVTTQTADFEWVVTGDGPEMRYLNNLTRTRAEVVAGDDPLEVGGLRGHGGRRAASTAANTKSRRRCS